MRKKVYVSEQTTQAEADVVITLTSNGFRLVAKPGDHVFEQREPAVFEFDPQKIEFWPDVLFAKQNQFGDLVLMWASEYMANRDGVVATDTRKSILDLQRRYSFAVALCEDKTWAIYANQKCFVTAEDGLEFEVVEVGWRKTMPVFYDYVPALRNFIAHKDARIAAMGRLRIPRALLAMEMQIDLLCTIVANLIAQKDPPEWSATFLAAIDREKAYTDAAKGILNIASEKNYTREIAEKYRTEVKKIYG